MWRQNCGKDGVVRQLFNLLIAVSAGQLIRVNEENDKSIKLKVFVYLRNVSDWTLGVLVRPVNELIGDHLRYVMDLDT